MKKLFVVLLSMAFVGAKAQTAEEIVNKYSNAMGGLENFNKTKTAKFTASLTTQGMTLPLTTQIVNGNSVRTDVTARGQSIVNVYHNGKAWKVNPLSGPTVPTEVTAASELLSFKLQTSLANNLMDYKSRGHQIVLQGQEMVDSVNTYKIMLTSKDDNKVTTYFINASNYLLVKSISKREIAGNEYNAEPFYSDFRSVDGLKFCHSYVQKVEGRVFQDVKYSKIELNIPIDEKIFEMPK